MNLKIGRGPAGMSGHSDGINASAFKPPLQFVGKEEIGEFALSISPLPVVALLAIEVVKVNFAKTMAPTASCNDASLGSLHDAIKQETGQGKMPQVIGAKL